MDDSTSAENATACREYLTYRLGGEEYGVDILKVQEIRSVDRVTRLPEAPEYIRGVVNLRGTIVPVVDMRIKFRLGTADYNEQTVMIVLNMEERTVGMVVDGVSDVLTLNADQIRPPPELSGALHTDFVTGIGAVDERMLILVDIDRLMDFDALDSVELQAQAA